MKRWFSVEGGRYCYSRYFGRWWVLSALHVWVGPFGVHIFWPDFWKSRPDFCADWRRPA